MRRLLSAAVVVALATAVAADTTACDARKRATPTGLSVSGSKLLFNGTPFVPRGFSMVGAETPPGCSNRAGIAARDHFGQTEMDALKTWNADTVRLQLSQSGLDGPDKVQYAEQIKADVTLARRNGMVVILSMQDQSVGCGPAHPLPSMQTLSSWKFIAPKFAADKNVMFELFNEPQNGVGVADWAQWKYGGGRPLRNLGDVAVGMQTLVNALRGLGITNVLLADGAGKSERFDGSPLLTEAPGGRGLLYAVHPYYFTPGPTTWDSYYGYLAGTVPVLATEWNYLASGCGPAASSAQRMAPKLLAYLEAHGIGMTAHAFDYLKTAVADWNWTPSRCGTAVGGSGMVTKAWFAHLAAIRS